MDELRPDFGDIKHYHKKKFCQSHSIYIDECPKASKFNTVRVTEVPDG